MKLLCTSIVAIASFCITGTSLGDFWTDWPTEFNGEASGDYFGSSVAIDGDTCVIGAAETNSRRGSAYVYTLDASGTWNQVAELSGEASWDYFGSSVAIDGDTCVIGATGTNSNRGSAYVYTSDANGTWNQVAEFNGEASGDKFGCSVAIDGDTCVIGAAYTTNSAAGSAYVFSKTSGTWFLDAELSGEAWDYFGSSVAIDGDTCVIGAAGTNKYTGSACVYTSDANGTWNQVAELSGEATNDSFGTSVAIDGDTCVIGAIGTNSYTGSAYVYTSDASGTWNQVAGLWTGVGWGFFGGSVAIDGDTCVIGANATNNDRGSVYVYTSDANGTWNQVAELNGVASWDSFGSSVAIDGDACVIGAPGYTGSAYLYGSNATTGACCVNSGCFDGTNNNQCTAASGTWTQDGSCDDCVAPPETCDADLDGDGEVKVADLLLLIGAWGVCP
jgi:hypothetical protein